MGITPRSYCNQALVAAGLPIQNPNTIAMLSKRLPPRPDHRYSDEDSTPSERQNPDYWKHPRPLDTDNALAPAT